MSPYSFSTGQSTSQPSPYFTTLYGNEYQTALQQQNANYQNILNQYGANQAAVQGQVAGVAAGYGGLSQQVLSGIQGIGASQAQAIQDVYAQQSGALNQQLIGRGLGNTTVVGSMQRGLTLDAQKAQIALANQIAQLYAGYQAQLGGAGLQAQLQGAGLQAQSGNVLTGALAGYRFPFPSWPPSQGRSTQQAYSGGGVRGGTAGGLGMTPIEAAGYGGQPFDLNSLLIQSYPPSELPGPAQYGGVQQSYASDPFADVPGNAPNYASSTTGGGVDFGGGEFGGDWTGGSD